MSPRKVSSSKKKPRDAATAPGRGPFIRTSISVASLREKTRQGLKRLTSKSSLNKKATSKAPPTPSRPSDENTPVTISTTTKKNARVNSSPAVKVFRPSSDDRTPQRKQPSRRVKTCKGPKQRHDNELEKRRVPVSMSSALQEMKGNLTKAVESVTTKLRINRSGLPGGRRSVRQSQYDPLLSGETPVKLYSPFAIGEFDDTPTGPRRGRIGPQGSGSSSTRTTPKNRREKRKSLKQASSNVSRNLLDTPTGKFREDLEDMRKGFEELTSLTRKIRDNAQQEKIWG